MNIVEFRNKKYWEKFVDLKKVNQEFNQNEKNRKKYFALKGKWKENSFECKMLKNSIIW